MAGAQEDIVIFSAPDTASLLSCVADNHGDFLLTVQAPPSLYAVNQPKTYDGNGMFSDPDDSVLLLADGEFVVPTGGPSETIQSTMLERGPLRGVMRGISRGM